MFWVMMSPLFLAVVLAVVVPVLVGPVLVRLGHDNRAENGR